MTPDTPVAVTLPVSQWQVVLAALAEVPYRLSAPVIQAIQAQEPKPEAPVS